jgi:hypothetical protein
MDGPSRGRVTSGAGAFALVLLAVLGWWLFSGNGPQGPSGNDARYAVPDVEATGSGAPSSSPRPVAAGAVPIDSYVVEDDLRLAVNYRTGAACADALQTPRVIESDVTVTITLSADVAGSPCGPPEERRTLRVLLDSPLDGRAVLDGARSPRVRVEPTSATYE